MYTLSRDADKMISGFSGVVAIDVTHPPCPFKTPLNDNCSPIFLYLYLLLLKSQIHQIFLAPHNLFFYSRFIRIITSIINNNNKPLLHSNPSEYLISDEPIISELSRLCFRIEPLLEI